MKRILITGANKGIGFATAKAVLEHSPDTAVLLGSRDAARGEAAVTELLQDHPEWASRVELLELDVTDPGSVSAAREQVEQASDSLYGLVNNAGIGLGSADMARVVAVNTLGVKRVCDAFLPLLQPGGRLVNVASASGPKFVSQCDPARQDFFKDGSIAWETLRSLIDEVIALQGDRRALGALGLGEANAYGFSKACVSLYTMILARENPGLVINACTPGYIETDLTRPSAESQGVSPADMGMKAPVHGTVSILFLLFGEPPGSGQYYGSDARRSPLDRYRAPDSPAYTGS